LSESRYLTAADLQRRWGINKNKARAIMRQLPTLVLGPRKRLVLESHVEAWERRHTEVPRCRSSFAKKATPSGTPTSARSEAANQAPGAPPSKPPASNSAGSSSKSLREKLRQKYGLTQ
jgi:hypothetical protein